MLPLHSPRGWLIAILVLLAPVARAIDLSAAPESAQAPAARTDELWFVSSRHLDLCNWGLPSPDDLDVRRLADSGDWENSSLAEFQAGEPRLTVVYVHGNRT